MPRQQMWRFLKNRNRENQEERQRGLEGDGKLKGKKKYSKERENRPNRLAAQLPHDFDLRKR